MRESPNKRAVIVGLFVLIGLSFLIGGILMVGNLHETFTNKVSIVSVFADVNGLQSGNNVWFSGVKVGTVKDIQFYGQSKVAVTVRVDVKAQKYIRKDAKVKISTDGFIGNKILVIFGGSEKSEAIAEGDTLQVENAVSQDEMMKILQESNRNLQSITTDFKSISKKMDSGEGTLGKLLNDNALYDNANNTIQSINRASVNTEKLIQELKAYSAQLNKEGTLANDLVTDTIVFQAIRSFSMQLKQIADTTSVFISHLKTMSQDSTTSIGTLLNDPVEGARLKEILKNLESSSKKLDQDLEAAQYSWPLKKGFKKMEKEKQ